MAGEETEINNADRPTVETGNEITERELLLLSIKSDLLMLARNSDEVLESRRIDVEKALDRAEQSLQKLKTQYPDEPDIYLFEQSLDDLRGDYEKGAETELDESFNILMDTMREVIAEAGVIRQSADEVAAEEDSGLGNTVKQLQSLGIRPEYAVRSPNVNSPTIVLFMQSHIRPHGAENIVMQRHRSRPEMVRALIQKRHLKSPEESQRQIEREISACMDSGIGSVLYDEAMPQGVELSEQSAQQALHDPEMVKMAFARLKVKKGDQIEVVGYDIDALKTMILEGKMDITYRIGAHNVFIASNFAEIHRQYQTDAAVSFMTLGGAHEAYPNDEVEHHIPISHALAYYGFNVVVIDAAYERA